MDMDQLADAANMFNIGVIVIHYLTENPERYAEFEKWLRNHETISVEDTENEGTILSDLKMAQAQFSRAARRTEAALNAAIIGQLFGGMQIHGIRYVTGDDFPSPDMN